MWLGPEAFQNDFFWAEVRPWYPSITCSGTLEQFQHVLLARDSFLDLYRMADCEYS